MVSLLYHQSTATYLCCLASEPTQSSNAQVDNVISQIDQRGQLAKHSNGNRAKTTTAQRFADQSPLGPKERYVHGLHEPEPEGGVPTTTEKSSEVTVGEALSQPTEKSTDVLRDSTNSIAHDDTIVSDAPRLPLKRSLRAHSWDSSQSSDYAYSEEATMVGASTDRKRNGSDEDDLDTAEDNKHDDDTIEDSIQLEDSRDEVHHSSENQNLDIIELVESESPDEIEIQETQPITEDQDSLNVQDSVDREHGGSSTPLEPAKVLDHKKGKKFGLFAASLGPDTEAVVDSVYIEPPKTLRDLVQKKRRERTQKEEPEERTRYNFRPRRLGRAYAQDSLPASPPVESDTEEGDRPTKLRRMTRSTTTQKQAKRPIPRSKAARKSAWSAMGITPKERPDGTKTKSQIVEVVIPVIDKSSWKSSPSRRQTAVDGIQVTSRSKSVEAEVRDRKKEVAAIVLID